MYSSIGYCIYRLIKPMNYIKKYLSLCLKFNVFLGGGFVSKWETLLCHEQNYETGCNHASNIQMIREWWQPLTFEFGTATLKHATCQCAPLKEMAK